MKKIAINEKKRSGFTLLEVLMVVLLVGIISGVVMLNVNFGGAERHLDDEANRLAELMQQAATDAVIQNQEYGLKINTHGYFFLCLNEESQRWQPCAQSSVFRSRELPDGLVLSARQLTKMALPLNDTENTRTKNNSTEDEAAEQKEITLADAQNKNGPRITPDIFLLSSGESSAASVMISVEEKPELNAEIVLNDIGDVRVLNADGTQQSEENKKPKEPAALANKPLKKIAAR